MRGVKSKSLRPVFITVLLLTLCFLSSAVHAVGGITQVRVVPSLPSIETYLWTGLAGNPTYLTGNYKQSGNTIEIDLYFLDYMKPDELYLCVCGNWKSTLDLDFLAQGDYQVVSRLWFTKDPAVLEIPPEQLNFNDFSFWQSYDYSFSLDHDYTSPFEPGLKFEDIIFFLGEPLENPVDGGTITDPWLLIGTKPLFVEMYDNSNVTSSVINIPEPASILLFASVFGLFARKRR